MQKKYILSGGIGDFLQSLPFILSADHEKLEFIVMSHQKDTQQLFSDLKISIKKFIFFETIEEQKKACSELVKDEEMPQCPRMVYFDQNPFPALPKVFKNEKKVIGIHLGGSTYSIGVQKQFNLPKKNLPPKIINELEKRDFNFLIFGSKKELEMYKIVQKDNIKALYNNSIHEALSYVSQCDLFIGSDSAFKTCAAMLKIPTFVWIGDYIDEFRDENFIKPYVTDGNMDVYRYQDLENSDQFDLGIKKTFEFIENTFNPLDKRIYTTLFNSNYGPMILNLKDKGVSGDILSTGYFESQQIELLIAITKFLLGRQKNITIYDVGANLGTHTLALAKLSTSRIHVRAFEVQSKIFYMLCGTVALNGLGNVDCHHLAVSDKDNEMIMVDIPCYSEIHNYGGFEVKKIIKTDNFGMLKPNKERVYSVTLDSFKEPVDLIKIDVEGMEEEVLFGAVDIFKTSSPICFIEIFKSDLEKIKSFFKSRNYIGYATKQDLLAIPSTFGLQVNGIQRIF